LTDKTKSPIDRTWDFLCSLKLTIILLLLLAVTSIIGTVLQQNAPAAEYIREYGESNYKLFVSLQFTDMYHSFWFIGILALFSVNLICCSIKNFPRVWKFVREPMLVASSGILKGSANRTEIETAEAPAEAARHLSTVLKKEFGSSTLTEADGKLYLFAQKGIYSRFGAYITHLSILIVMAGAIIGNLWGYKAYVNIIEGTSTDQVVSRSSREPIDLGFTVRCDDFDVSYYPNSMRPKDYNSDLVVLEDGVEILRKRIEVNDPLTYKGITFYQSSYGPAGNPILKLQAKNNATGETADVTVQQGRFAQVADGYSVAVTNFVENDRNFGPAAGLIVSDPAGKQSAPFPVWQRFADLDTKRNGTFTFTLVSFDMPQYTGLQVAKDPGVNIVWLGCFLMIFGSMSAFFFSHKRVWACIEETPKGSQIVIAANAHRNQPGFALAFEELQQKIENDFKNSSQQKEG